MNSDLTTGIPGLDKAVRGLLPGDNIVWQVDAIEDYAAFVLPYVRAAARTGRALVYFRFADHPPLVPRDVPAEVHELRPEGGFEAFIARIHEVIEAAGRGALYVFDCLSDLAGDWYSDQMLGNFFMLTCPYLYDLETIAYFAILRDQHSIHALQPIAGTTQLFLEAYRHRGRRYVRPVKVQSRYTSTLHMLHALEGDRLTPVRSSALVAEILTAMKWSGLYADRRPGFWERTFREAEEVLGLLRYGRCPPETAAGLFRRLSRMLLSREGGILRLVSEYLTLEDLLDVRRRMIGTGLIGGKAVGMLLARAILRRHSDRIGGLLEAHDSFYIGSDVFYTFLVHNGAWWLRQRRGQPDAFLQGAEEARRRILTGTFPASTVRPLEEMLDYFGQSPFIVRSSSLLEDNYGNSFAGKYDSVFCANQGPREKRLEDLLGAVRTVYASTLSEKALRYRAQRGLLDLDEQMALLVMRVSGTIYGKAFYPPVAGVGFSFNPYAWHRDIDPRAGVLRLVFGLGTRAVDRADDDYTRIVALNAPDRRPEANFDERRQYAQRRVDFIDLEASHLAAGAFEDLIGSADDLPRDLFVSPDPTHRGSGAPEPVLTFDNLLLHTEFVRDMREALRLLQTAYACPVDVEFTANFEPDGAYRINLLQCRPLHVRGADDVKLPAITAAGEDRVIEARGAVIGTSRLERLDRLIYVVPSVYGGLPPRERYEVARLLGTLNRALKPDRREIAMLLGPGRWGTASPELGLPVAFADINRVAVLCEIVTMRKGLVPDVSLGTHFLNELVEMDMLYVALFPEQGNNHLREAFFTGAPNRLLDLAPGASKWENAVRVVNAADVAGANRSVMLAADALDQRVVCYLA